MVGITIAPAVAAVAFLKKVLLFIYM